MGIDITRRHFVKTTAIGGATLLGGLSFAGNSLPDTTKVPGLIALSENLLNTWANALLKLQVTNKNNTHQYGSFIFNFPPALETVISKSFLKALI
ncbi:MAG: hypothetical protein JWQ25_316 [Daejeonella sp.]|nr:hypothetical protein [Daejeonella sp.]